MRMDVLTIWLNLVGRALARLVGLKPSYSWFNCGF